MAIPWFSVLQAVPWGQVIENAPKVVDGAKKLWSTVATKSTPQEFEVEDVQPMYSDDGQALKAIRSRLTALEKSTADLHKQMLASSELIKTLADQNAQLIQRIEANRKRMVFLTVICVVMSVTAVVGLAYVLNNLAL
jgi:tRNA A37 threonylcarbamoyladenosine dehydratase